MFEIYKKGQGGRARWIAAGGLGAMAAFGCYELQEYLSGKDWASAGLNIAVGTLPVSVLVSALMFVACAVLIALVINQPRFVDYLITSEIELRKVSWPTKDELKRQTVVVIVTLAFFGIVLLLTDLVLALGSTNLYKL